MTMNYQNNKKTHEKDEEKKNARCGRLQQNLLEISIVPVRFDFSRLSLVVFFFFFLTWPVDSLVARTVNINTPEL